MPEPAIAEMGHNLPPDLPTILSESFVDLVREVEEMAARANKTTRKIDAPEDLNAIGVLVVDTRALRAKVEGTRKRVKEPYLEAERTVQSFFMVHIDRLDRIAEAFQKIADGYQRAVAKAARDKAEAEAQALREAEARQRDLAMKADEANRGKASVKHEAKADDLAKQAREAEKLAGAKAADLTRTRTSSGVVASATTQWKGTVSDWTAIDLEVLRPYIKREAIEAALNSAVRMGARNVRGAIIEPVTKANFR